MRKIELNHVRTRIREVLLHTGYTQQEWAAMLQVSQPSISNYLKGRIPPVEVLSRIADLARIPLETLLFAAEYTTSTEIAGIAENKQEYRQAEIVELYNRLPEKIQKPFLQMLHALAEEFNNN